MPVTIDPALKSACPSLALGLVQCFAGIHTRDDLADLAVDELTEMSGVDEEQAKVLIMKAREHWFQAEK